MKVKQLLSKLCCCFRNAEEYDDPKILQITLSSSDKVKNESLANKSVLPKKLKKNFNGREDTMDFSNPQDYSADSTKALTVTKNNNKQIDSLKHKDSEKSSSSDDSHSFECSDIVGTNVTESQLNKTTADRQKDELRKMGTDIFQNSVEGNIINTIGDSQNSEDGWIV